MSKKKWILGLIVFVLYLLLGASFFHKIESEHEEEGRNATRALRNQVLGKFNCKYKRYFSAIGQKFY